MKKSRQGPGVATYSTHNSKPSNSTLISSSLPLSTTKDGPQMSSQEAQPPLQVTMTTVTVTKGSKSLSMPVNPHTWRKSSDSFTELLFETTEHRLAVMLPSQATPPHIHPTKKHTKAKNLFPKDMLHLPCFRKVCYL